MGDSVSIKAKKRDLNGPKPNALRRDGHVPAVIHNHGKESVHVVLDASELARAYSAAGKHAPVDVDVDGKKFTALIREVAYKPSTKLAYHSVFQAVKANEKIVAEIPIKLGEDIPAERASLLVVKSLDHVEVEAFPKDLVDVLEIDASSLAAAGDKLHVSDIKAPEGIVIKTDPENVVASVETPKDQIAEADAALEEMAEQTEASSATEEPAENETGDSAEPKHEA